MKNLNADTIFCIDVKKDNNSIMSYNHIFDVIVPERGDKSYFVSNMVIVENLSVVLDEKNNEKNNNDANTIKGNSKYECLLSYTVDGKRFNGISKFTIDTSENSMSPCGQRKFRNYTFITEKPRIEIPDKAAQLDIVLLIRDKSDQNEADAKTQWVFQTAKRLFIDYEGLD